MRYAALIALLVGAAATYAPAADAQDEIERRSTKTYKKKTKKKVPVRKRAQTKKPQTKAPPAQAPPQGEVEPVEEPPEVAAEDLQEEIVVEEEVDEQTEEVIKQKAPPAPQPETAAPPVTQAEPEEETDISAEADDEVEVDVNVAIAVGPDTLSYERGDQVPNGYVLDRQIRTGWVVGGAVMLGVGWLAAAATASHIISNRDEGRVDDLEDVPGEAVLYIPVAGPFIALDTADPNGPAQALLIANGVLQSAGLLALIVGLADQKEVLVRENTAGVRVTPYASTNGAGLGAVGRF